MTPLGIELATFWLLAQCLRQLRHRVPASIRRYRIKFSRYSEMAPLFVHRW